MSLPTSTDTATALQLLLDRTEITALVHRLGRALDEKRFDEFRLLFTEDASATTPGGTALGHDAMIKQASKVHLVEDHIQHRITDIIIDLSGDRASVRANLAVTFIRQDPAIKPHLMLGEIYRFRAVRTSDGWRLSRVESQPIWALNPMDPRQVTAPAA